MSKRSISGWTCRLASLLALLVASPLAAVPAQALRSGTGAPVCKAAAQAASARTGVPLPILRAIALTETGRKQDGGFGPWLGTVNMEGVGAFLDSPAEAMASVEPHFARGAHSFDVRSFQLTYRWHGVAFTSVEQMFEPEANALYAPPLRAVRRSRGDGAPMTNQNHLSCEDSSLNRLRAHNAAARHPMGCLV